MSLEIASKRIKPLDPQLVNRIAAGEIIQRPFNALKELIENCLDAGSTSINIQIKEGGLKLIQISDNGCGINKEDLKIVCERFTTSKLKEFEDLKSINTFGFRGEALASISHVSRLTIITKTQDSPCAFKAMYSDGKLAKDGIKPCAAASRGTQIIVEDLFYNSSIRRNALKGGSDEFAKIYEVVSRYAIHNYHVGFYLKRIGESSMDLKTPGCSIRSVENENYLQDVIGILYGADMKKELERISVEYDDRLKFEMLAYMTNSRYTQLKQLTFVLFINERLVDCQPIKKSLQNLFQMYLPKSTNPFIYMNLKIDPKNLDVNIHPTKHEVRFLYQDEIISRIEKSFEEKLLDSSTSRSYYVKNLTLDTFIGESQKSQKKSDSQDSEGAKTPIYPYQLTRVDSKERKLDSFLHQTSLNDSIKVINRTKASSQDKCKSMLRGQDFERSFNFKSLSELRENVEKNSSKNLKQVMGDLNFVGCIERELALIQYQTGLYILNTRLLSEELFYQICLFNFGNFGYFNLSEPLDLFDLAIMALNDPRTEWTEEDGPKEKLAKRCAKFLYSKSALLDDYFSIKVTKRVDSEGENKYYLEALPMLIEDYEPDLVDLPLFVIRLATEVEWPNEKECFDSISKEIGYFYAIKNLKYEQDTHNFEENSSQNNDKMNESWMIEHVLYKAFVNMLLPSEENEQQTIFKLVDLSKLYRVFERC
uniref:MLH1 n=1 Tax=Brachionus koreanus TaxID=1199090 RepID=A0A088DKT4_9BILA|nr:MLH1 [Brachionus koreanus]